ncbi:MAG: nitrogen fixation protein NifM [Gammaproteobacteria bacterium]|nr:nitrogen fixation protein NifM [Gammaproteobacteria bacterium]
MSGDRDQGEEVQAALQYHRLRHALAEFQKGFYLLTGEEQKRVEAKAGQSFQLESKVISSSEAAVVYISEQQLTEAVAEVEGRYESHTDFVADLEANGLSESLLRQALYRELLFDGVLQRIGAQSAEVTDDEVRSYHEAHPEKFHLPQRRLARHILITVNNDYPENSEVQARQRLEEIATRLGSEPDQFAQFAKRYSECPTAMEGGKLGELRPGQLYPELDRELFTMSEGAVSPLLRSEIGFHLLFLEKIVPEAVIPFSAAAPKIRQLLQQQRQRAQQKRWIAQL